MTSSLLKVKELRGYRQKRGTPFACHKAIIKSPEKAPFCAEESGRMFHCGLL